MSNIQKQKNIYRFYLSCFVFRLLLEYSYIAFVNRFFEDEGFEVYGRGVAYIESWFIFLFGCSQVPKHLDLPSDYLVALAFFVFIGPVLVFYGYSEQNRWSLYLIFAQYILMTQFRKNLCLQSLRKIGTSSFATWLAVLVSLLSTVWIVDRGGVQNFNLDLNLVYDFRDKSTETIYNGIPGYFVAWSTTVAGPFLIAQTLRTGRYWLTIAVLFLHIFWFGTTSHKSVLFYGLIPIIMFHSTKRRWSVSFLPIGISVVIVVALAIYSINSDLMAGSMFVRRVLFVPPRLTFLYHAFFSRENMVYWSNSFLSYFVKYPYQEPIPLMIGGELNDTSLWANVGFFGTGFMHAGFFGAAIYAFAAGYILALLDSIARSGVPNWFVLATVTVPFYNLYLNSDLPTLLLTHGLGLGLVLSYFMIETNDKSRNLLANSNAEKDA
jgi:hypothetical protein